MPKTEWFDEDRESLISIETDKEVKAVVEALSALVNRYGYRDLIASFSRHMSYQHPTLQQAIGTIILGWLKYLSTLQEFQYDLRNQDLVEFSKAVYEHVPEHKRYLRFI